MAASAYYSCDVCGGKTFYDQPLWDNLLVADDPWSNVGQMSVLCTDCAKTHDVTPRPKQGDHVRGSQETRS